MKFYVKMYAFTHIYNHTQLHFVAHKKYSVLLTLMLNFVLQFNQPQAISQLSIQTKLSGLT